MATRDTNDIDSPWLTPQQAAAYLGVALGTIRNLTSAKVLPFAKRRHIVRYHRDALDQWLSRDACLGRRTFVDKTVMSKRDSGPKTA